MKKTVYALFVLFAFLLASCSRSTGSACDMLVAFCSEYPISASVYTSIAEDGDARQIDRQMLLSLYGVDGYPTDEFAIALYGKVGSVREIGVFFTDNGVQRAELFDLINSRISFLSSFSDGEGFVKKYGEIIVYGFVDDAARAVGIFDMLI